MLAWNIVSMGVYMYIPPPTLRPQPEPEMDGMLQRKNELDEGGRKVSETLKMVKTTQKQERAPATHTRYMSYSKTAIHIHTYMSYSYRYMSY